MTDHAEDDEFWHDGTDGVTCPKCDGWGNIDCNCGGDLCVCTNYGERTCPVCGGEGDVSEARYEQYQAAQREWWAAYQAAVNARARRIKADAPGRWSKHKPLATPKRAKVKAARKQRQRHA